MPGQHNFEHLELLLRFQGRARLQGGGEVSPQTIANRQARQAHSKALQLAAQTVTSSWKTRNAEQIGRASCRERVLASV